MARVQYTEDEAQTAELYPPARLLVRGVPTAATYSLHRTRTSKIVDAASITIDTASTTIASATEGDKNLTVADSSNFKAGRRYWVSDAGGVDGYEVVCDAVPDATTVRLRDPLRIDITSGTIKGHGLRYSLTTTHTDTEYRWLREVWSMTIDSETHKISRLVDIVAEPFEIYVTETEIEQADISFGGSAGSSTAWQAHVSAATDAIWQDLEGNGIWPDLVRSRDLLTRPLVYRTLFHRHGRDPDLREHYLELYKEAMGAFYGSKNAWYDSDDDLNPEGAQFRTVTIGDTEYTLWQDEEGQLHESEVEGIHVDNSMRVG